MGTLGSSYGDTPHGSSSRVFVAFSDPQTAIVGVDLSYDVANVIVLCLSLALGR